MHGIDANGLAVRADSGMRVDSPLARIFPGQMKLAQVDAATGRDMIEVGDLHPTVGLGVGVVQDPIVVGQVRQMTTRIEDPFSDLPDM